MKKINCSFILVVLMFLFPVLCGAQDFDGSKSLACAVIEVNECAPGIECTRGIAEDFNFPQFIIINFKEKTIVGTSKNEKLLTTPIDKVEIQEGHLILHGSQNGRSWSMVISQKTGHMTGTVSAEDFSFTLFGACIAK